MMFFFIVLIFDYVAIDWLYMLLEIDLLLLLL